MKLRQIVAGAMLATVASIGSESFAAGGTNGIQLAQYVYEPDPYYQPDNNYVPEGFYEQPAYVPPTRGYRVSCDEARRIVRRNGYRRIRVLDCKGKKYNFLGWRAGRVYAITMRSKGGRIVTITESRGY